MIVDDGGKLFNERVAAKALFHERIRARAAELVLPGENSVARYQQATTDILKDLNEEEEEQLLTAQLRLCELRDAVGLAGARTGVRARSGCLVKPPWD